MKCPICGKEMEKGYIQSGRTAFFTTKKKHVFFVAGSQDVVLTEDNFTCPTGDAYNCKECKKIIIDYSSPEESSNL